MASGSVSCPRCKNSFLPLRDGAGEICPHCGAKVAVDTEPPASGGPPPLPLPGPLTKSSPPPSEAAPLGRTRGYELPIALVAVLMLAGGYWLIARNGVPRASSGIGYTLGIVGLLLMLSTETLYTLRKRVHRFHFGRMSVWLQIHIVTGIVGPCLVLLHSGGKFHGLAGILALLTVVIVASGFIGRYIYTAVPRTLDGVEVAVLELEEQIAEFDREVQTLGVDLAGTETLAIATEVPRRGWLLVLGRVVLRWRQRRRLHRAMRSLKAAGIATGRLEQMLMAQYCLQVQIASLATTRRLLALWHVLHIPLGAGVFTLAFIHVVGAVYYASLAK